MFKRITAVFILICLALSAVPVFGEHWADDTIQDLYERGYIASIEDANPDFSITRAEFVKLINKCFNYKVQLLENYPDVFETKWYYQDFGIAKYIGYLTGDENGNANPENYMTRAECAVMLGRILKSRMINPDRFSDQSDIPAWAVDYVSQLSALSILNGYPDGSFQPNGLVTRAEAFTIIQKVDSLIRFEEGEGTAEQPYVIRTPYQFNHIRDYVWESRTPFFILEDDINLSVIDYQPTGTQDFPFQGVLDGKGHSVQYEISGTVDGYAGLFGYNAGTIKSIKVSGECSSNVASGIIAGENKGNLLYCISEGAVTVQNIIENSEVTAGGIVGVNNGYVYACYNRSDVSLSELQSGSKGYAGGICGYNNREISGCINGGQVNAAVEEKGEITGLEAGVSGNCYSESTATLDVLDPAVWNEQDGRLVQTPFIQKILFQNGTGTENDPYLISTPEEFSSLRFQPEAYYQLTQDIDLENYPGFTFFEEFSGSFDGQEYCIKNLTLDRSNIRKSGLFILNNGIIRNLRLDQCNISGKTNVAGITNTNYGKIENCSISGSLNLKNENLANINLYLGAFAAENYGSIVSCVNEAAINVESSASDDHLIIGGITGDNTNLIDECKNVGAITVAAYGAGARVETGGITGNNTNGDIYDSANSAFVSAYSKSWVIYAGGITAYNTGTITKAANSAEIKAESDTSSAFSAGIAAQNARAVELSENSGSIQSISQDESATSGGIVAWNSDWVSSCNNTAAVSSMISNQENSSIAGGVAGHNTHVIANCNNSGTVSAIGGESLRGDICGFDVTEME